MYEGNFFPLLAGFGELGSRHTAVIFHFVVALLIGATFGLLFQRDIHSYGSSMGWGLGYAMFWWFLGQLTILPVLSGNPIDWSADRGSELFGSLVGHIIYGLILGVVYASFDRFWVRLFIQSDPLNREREGPGFRLLRSLQWGAAAGLSGGLVSSPIMLATGILPKVAGLGIAVSIPIGLLVHLLTSALVGMSYGLLFRNEGPNLGTGRLMGMVVWHDLVVPGTHDAASLDAHWRVRLERRRRIQAAAVFARASCLWRRDGAGVSPHRTALHSLAVIGPEGCRP